MKKLIYELVKPAYVVDRQCPLYTLAEIANEVSEIFKENGIEFFIGGSSALGTNINVTSDYMRKRTSCDLDLFVSESYLGKVDGIMESTEWAKYDKKDCGLMRVYSMEEGSKVLLDEYQNIFGLDVYRKVLPEFGVNFLLYMSKIGKYEMHLTKDSKLVRFSGYNRSPEESFVHKIFRNQRRDRSDFMAVMETSGFDEILQDMYADETFRKYLGYEKNVEKLDNIVERARKTRDYYWGSYRNGLPHLKNPSNQKFRILLHNQKVVLRTNSNEFRKLMYGLSNRIHWLDTSIEIIENRISGRLKRSPSV